MVSILSIGFLVIFSTQGLLTEGKQFLGCFHPQSLELNTYRRSDDRAVTGMTIDRCIERCKGQDYTYAGVTDTAICRCGNNHNHTALGPQLDSSRCTENCVGDARPQCGSISSLSLYAVCIAGNFGASCSRRCHCESDHICGYQDGACPHHCATGWGGVSCSEQGFRNVTDPRMTRATTASDGLIQTTQSSGLETSDDAQALITKRTAPVATVRTDKKPESDSPSLVGTAGIPSATIAPIARSTPAKTTTAHAKHNHDRDHDHDHDHDDHDRDHDRSMRGCGWAVGMAVLAVLLTVSLILNVYVCLRLRRKSQACENARPEISSPGKKSTAKQTCELQEVHSNQGKK